MVKSVGSFYVCDFHHEDIMYLRHNRSYTTNILMARKFMTAEAARQTAEDINAGMSEEERNRNGLEAVEMVLRPIPPSAPQKKPEEEADIGTEEKPDEREDERADEL